METIRDRLLEAGMTLLLQRGYNAVGLQAVLQATGTPKGSFYHHFRNKEDFALQAIDRYMEQVHEGLDAALCDPAQPPLARVRRFFEISREKYREEGHLGCMLGGAGPGAVRRQRGIRRQDRSVLQGHRRAPERVPDRSAATRRAGGG